MGRNGAFSIWNLGEKVKGKDADAEDLAQDVLLAAYAYMDKGGIIENMKSWLSGTLNHKYYDMLRKKYKMPLISIDLISEQAIWEEEAEDGSVPPMVLVVDEGEGVIK